VEAERQVIHCRTKELLLSSPAWEREWLAPLRRDPSRRPAHLPKVVEVTYRQAAGQSTDVTVYDRLPAGYRPTHPC
jgi:hypothetical protein